MSKPKVCVLMAIYNPNLTWLKEQLISINNQDYDDIELLVCDDCSTSITIEQITGLIQQYIRRFPFRLIKNEINLGSNKTFERLTLEASNSACGQEKEFYFAYCDQDDIWEREKIPALINTAQEKNAVLVYSDMSIIDSEGKLISNSITKLRKRFNYHDGENLWRKILVRNFISGCCMIVRADIAKGAIPFESDMQHDRWVSIIASNSGYIALVDKALVRYRQHGKNQTGVLKDVTDKASYIQIRIKDHLKILENIKARADINEEMAQFLSEYIKQIKTRLKYAEGEGRKLFKMLSYIKYNRATILFEIIAMRLPDKMFKKTLNVIVSRNM